MKKLLALLVFVTSVAFGQTFPVQNLLVNGSVNFNGNVIGALSNPSFNYQASQTSSVARSYQTKFSDVLSVKDFGATGNGTTNDTVAIQNTIAAAEILGSAVYIPADTYLVSGTLSVTSTIAMYGDGMGHSILEITSSQNTPVIQVSSAGANYSLFRDFTIKSTVNTAAGNDGLQIAGGLAFVVSHVEVYGTYNGINVNAITVGAYLTDSFVHNTLNNGIEVDAGNMVVHDDYAINCGNVGFLFTAISNGSAGLIVTNDTGFNNNSGNFQFVGNSTFNFVDLVVANCVSSASPHGAGYLFNTFGRFITVSNIFSELAGMSETDTFVSNQVGTEITVNNGGVALNNLFMIGSSLSGLEIDSNDVSVSGGFFTGNNAIGNAEGAGIVLGVTNAVTSINITGVNTSVPSGATNLQAFGVNSFTSGNTGIITGSVLHGTVGSFQNIGSTATFSNNLDE